MKARRIKIAGIAACLVIVVTAAFGIPFVANRNNTPAVPNDTTVITNDVTVDDTANNIYDPSEGHGTTEIYNYSTDMIPEYLFINDNADIPATLPVYTYNYGTGQGGALYGALNDSERALVKSKLDTLLSECYENLSLSEDSYIHEDTTVTAFVDEVRFRADPETISILTESLNIPEEVLYGDLSEVELISDCIKYLGIVNPVIMNFGATDVDRSRGDYYIFDNGDDSFEENIMKFAIVRTDFNGNIGVVFLKEISFGEKYGEYDTIPYNVALEQIKTKYPEMDTENIKAIRYYKFDYRQVIGSDGSYGGDGYYVPCYRFFVGSSDQKITGCAMIDVAITDFTAGDTLVLE